ncbi:MAG TPA: hypothetical protein PKY59_00995 [Pyrinomonadaceae bacterium]|nr:hypothetical protein [Pyrinomonadaceae bacterium]
MLYKEWIDFVVYPSNANKVKSREERLKTDNAVSELENDSELGKKFGLRVSWNDYAFSEDCFEAMWIDDDGNVIIWTEKRVWSLHRRIDGKEKMTYVPRNPDLTLLF